MQEPTNPSVVEAYLSRQSKALGITLIILGGIAFIANGISFIYEDFMARLGHGFWCGAMFIFTGGFGVGAASKSRCQIKSFMILGFFSSVIAFILFPIALLGSFANDGCSRNSYLDKFVCDNQGLRVAMESILCAVSIVAFVVSIWSYVICCKALCCCGPSYGVVVAAPHVNQQMSNSQQPGTVQCGNQQVITVPLSPPSYQLVSGPPQYGSTVSEPPPDTSSSTGNGATASTPPPAYAELFHEKEFKL